MCLTFSASNGRLSLPKARRDRQCPVRQVLPCFWFERVWSCLVKPRRAGEPGNTKSGWLILVDSRGPTRMRKRRQFVTFSKFTPGIGINGGSLANGDRVIPGLCANAMASGKLIAKIRIPFASIIRIESQDTRCTTTQSVHRYIGSGASGAARRKVEIQPAGLGGQSKSH
jgi:hypothetical protein